LQIHNFLSIVHTPLMACMCPVDPVCHQLVSSVSIQSFPYVQSTLY